MTLKKLRSENLKEAASLDMQVCENTGAARQRNNHLTESTLMGTNYIYNLAKAYFFIIGVT